MTPRSGVAARNAWVALGAAAVVLTVVAAWDLASGPGHSPTVAGAEGGEAPQPPSGAGGEAAAAAPEAPRGADPVPPGLAPASGGASAADEPDRPGVGARNLSAIYADPLLAQDRSFGFHYLSFERAALPAIPTGTSAFDAFVQQKVEVARGAVSAADWSALNTYTARGLLTALDDLGRIPSTAGAPVLRALLQRYRDPDDPWVRCSNDTSSSGWWERCFSCRAVAWLALHSAARVVARDGEDGELTPDGGALLQTLDRFLSNPDLLRDVVRQYREGEFGDESSTELESAILALLATSRTCELRRAAWKHWRLGTDDLSKDLLLVLYDGDSCGLRASQVAEIGDAAWFMSVNEAMGMLERMRPSGTEWSIIEQELAKRAAASSGDPAAALLARVARRSGG